MKSSKGLFARGPLVRRLTTAAAAVAFAVPMLAGCDADDTPPEPKAQMASVQPAAPAPSKSKKPSATDEAPATPDDGAEHAVPVDDHPQVQAPPAEEVPATPTTRSLLIDNLLYDFPAPRLHLTRTDEGVVSARLYSDDPDEAIDAAYTGNSFYFQMPLPVSNPAQLDKVVWSYQAPDSERSRKPEGIYLKGTLTHLQPFDVEAEFEGTPPNVTVTVRGQFLTFDSPDSPGVPRLVNVWGRLPATVDEEKKDD